MRARAGRYNRLRMKSLQLELATPVKLLLLIGGGEFSFGETREIDGWMLERRRKDAPVAFLPTASGSAEYATHFGSYLKTIDESAGTVNVPVYRGRDNRRQRNLDQLMAAGLIYVGGGVTTQLLSTLRESPAELAMRDAAGAGTPVAAMGAAAACFGTHARDARGVAGVPALGWLKDAVIETGFDPASDTMLRRLMSYPDVRIGIGIPPRTALAVHADGSTEIVGDESIVVFRKG